MPNLSDYQELAQAGLRPVRCFPNSFRPLFAELHGDDESDEDLSGWDDFNLAIRACKSCSALVFKDFEHYRSSLSTLPAKAKKSPAVLLPDLRVALWFKNSRWLPTSTRKDDIEIVNLGLLPAPPSRVGRNISTYLNRPANLKLQEFGFDGGSVAADFEYADAVIPLRGFLSFSFPEPKPYVAGGLLDDKSKLAIIGEPKVGKSRFALNMAYCLALKEPFLDFEIERAARVLFVQFEVSDPRFHQRVNGLAHEYRLEADTNVGLYFASMSKLHLDTVEGAVRFDSLIQASEPDIVMLDPLYKIHRSDENSASEMQQGLYDKLDEIRTRYDVAVVVTHHVNKRADAKLWMRVRGTGQLPAWVDSQITLDKPGKNSPIEAVGMLRSGEAFTKTITFNDNHRLLTKGDSTAMEVFCAELAINQPHITRKQMASKVSKEFGVALAEVHEFFRHLEDKGYLLPQ